MVFLKCCWAWRFEALPLLAFLIGLQITFASCSDSHQDWTTCSRHALDRPMVPHTRHGTCPLASDWSPWSQQPLCPSVEDDNSVPSDCVFTHATFRGNQGISLITTANLAASIAEYLDDSRLPPEVKHELSNATQNNDAAYDIRDLPGRGKGVMASRRLARQERIMVGFPVLVVRLEFINGDRYTRRQKRMMMEAGVRQLPHAQQQAISALARSTGGEPILDTIRTNAFGIEIDGVQHLALFITASRLNHNCRPNAFWRYVNSIMAAEVIAILDIQEGEEVAQSYAPLGYTYEERRSLLESWGFRCKCAMCSVEKSERDMSDERRERLLDIYQTVSQASELSDVRLKELVDEALWLIDVEALQPQLVEYYQQFGRAWLMKNDAKEARGFIVKAEEMWQLFGGEEHENITGMQKLWKALQEVEREQR